MYCNLENKSEESLIIHGKVFVQDNQAGNNVLQRLDALKMYQVFVIRKKATAEFFNSHITHEILDQRKNVILRATQPRTFFRRKPTRKIAVRNFRNVKLFGIAIESTNNLDATQTEATVYTYPKKQNSRIAHVEKYGGTYGPASFEIFNTDGKTAFTIDALTGPTHQSSKLEFDISTKTGNVANITVKSGLNFMLSTNESVQVIEKATLIAVILAMDLLKQDHVTKIPRPAVTNICSIDETNYNFYNANAV